MVKEATEGRETIIINKKKKQDTDKKNRMIWEKNSRNVYKLLPKFKKINEWFKQPTRHN